MSGSHLRTLRVRSGYESLADVLQQALDQAQGGKGAERHQINDTPFDRQPILEIGRMVGPGGPAQQVIKKTQEALRLPADRGIAELLGAINYAAAVVILLTEQRDREAQANPEHSPADGLLTVLA